MNPDQKSPSNPAPSLDLIFAETQRRMADQLASSRAIDTKAAVTMSFASALVAALFGLDWFKHLRLRWEALILVVFLAAIGCAVVALLVRRYRQDPDPRKLIEGYLDRAPEETKRVLILVYRDSYEANEKPLMAKARALSASFIVLAAAIFILIIVFLATIHNKS